MPQINTEVDSRLLRCPTCRALCLAHSILDSRRGNTVRVQMCLECGECLWDDDPKLCAAGIAAQ